jgi:hypothetical protein
MPKYFKRKFLVVGKSIGKQMSVCSLPFGRLLRLCGNNWRFIRRSRLCLAYFNTYERRRREGEAQDPFDGDGWEMGCAAA